MTQSGDVVNTVSGRFSASVSFIFSQVIEGVPLSKALAAACDKGLCEPDPRDDLNGVDNARSLVVLARDLGIELELTLIPTATLTWVYAQEGGDVILGIERRPLKQRLDDRLRDLIRVRFRLG